MEVVKVRERRASERVKVEKVSKEEREEEKADRQKSRKRNKDAKKLVKAFKDKKYGDLNTNEKEVLLQAVGVALGLIKS